MDDRTILETLRTLGPSTVATIVGHHGVTGANTFQLTHHKVRMLERYGLVRCIGSTGVGRNAANVWEAVE